MRYNAAEIRLYGGHALFYKALFISLLCSLILWGCGFHLRGQNILPAPFHVLYVETEEPYGQFESDLKATLRSSGIILVASRNQAPITLFLSKPGIVQNSTTPAPSSQSRVFNITYAVTISLLDPRGRVLLKPQRLSSTRNLILSPNQLLETNNQLHLLEQEMQRDVINQLYNRLRSPKVMRLLQNSHPVDVVP